MYFTASLLLFCPLSAFLKQLYFSTFFLIACIVIRSFVHRWSLSCAYRVFDACADDDLFFFHFFIARFVS